jgi:hypothetical protein
MTVGRVNSIVGEVCAPPLASASTTPKAKL